ncbi:MAG: hypothetical protein LC772_07550 [Chloroflexi bacterium]|nr:hypothetical protein [Chloroflexota bacterium]
MLGPSRIFPVRPEEPGREERHAREFVRRRYEMRLGQLAHRADWLAEMWSEFPDVADRHRYYARSLRGAAATLWLTEPSSHQKQIELRLRQLAWRAYRRSARPTNPASSHGLHAAAQRQKVDTYWARQLWAALGEGGVHESILSARDFELQQLCDSAPQRSSTPGLFRLFIALLRRLSPWRR